MRALAALGPLLLLHAFLAFALARLARRLEAPATHWAWAPLVNLGLPFRLAGLSPAWALLLALPPVSFVVWAGAWTRLMARLGRDPRLGPWMAVPGLNLALLGELAGLGRAMSALAAVALSAALLAGGAAAASSARRPAPDPGRFPALVAALQDQDASARQAAARGVLEVAPALPPIPDTIPGLLQAARVLGPGPIAHAALADALARPGPPALEPLVAALRDPGEAVRWHAAAGLARLGRRGNAAVAALFVAMRDEAWTVRNAAGFALECVALRHDVPALERALVSPDVETRYHAARALEALGREARDGRAALAAALGDEDMEVRLHSVKALGSFAGEDAQALAALATALRDVDPEVRRASVWALAATRRPEAVSALQAARDDADREVRKAVARSLKALGAR